jgi:hypothetical protein
MRTHRWFWALAAALLASCAGYGAPDEVLYGNAVYTQPKPSFDFKPLGTYYLDPDYKLVEDANSSNVALPSAVIATIDQNMQALGYTKSADLASIVGQAGAVGIKVSLLKGTGAVYYPGYWCDYWYYYSCWYDWTYAGSYVYGTVMLEMGDLSVGANPPDGKLPILWLGAIYGVSGGATFDIPRVQAGIDRAFAQSQYLDTH